ncbi:hypothetical protein ACS6YB_08420 [Streptococcus suis]
MKWNKFSLRKTDSEEKAYFGTDEIWNYPVPDSETKVLVSDGFSIWLDGRLPRQRMLDKIDELYEQTKDTKPKVLAQRGKIRILYPYYSHQRQPWEK